jgi:hypothetical protein
MNFMRGSAGGQTKVLLNVMFPSMPSVKGGSMVKFVLLPASDGLGD